MINTILLVLESIVLNNFKVLQETVIMKRLTSLDFYEESQLFSWLQYT